MQKRKVEVVADDRLLAAAKLPRKPTEPSACRKGKYKLVYEDSSVDDCISLSSTSDAIQPPPLAYLKHFKDSQYFEICSEKQHELLTGRPKTEPKHAKTNDARIIRNTTNLKRITYAQQPDDQKQITQFFRTGKPSSSKASFFETHAISILSDSTDSLMPSEHGINLIPDIMLRIGETTVVDHLARKTDQITNNNDDSGCDMSASCSECNESPIDPKLQLGRCPPYKVVERTRFAVDAFRYGDIVGVTKYFLTHYHSDHFIGLKRSFHKPLYLSTITANLVRKFIGVDRQYMTEMELNTDYDVEDDIKVVALDANHCPGAVMFLFKFSDGRCTLHTGDFRASAEMESYPQFWNCNIDTVYLDTTYMKNKANFQLQMHSISEIKTEVHRFLEKNMMVKFLIVVGTYTIGKEKVWMAIAKEFEIKVWLEETRRKAAYVIYGKGSRALRWLVDDKEEASMHVLPLNAINYKLLVEYQKEYSDRVVLGIRPSGWESGNAGKCKFNSCVSLIGVQYSEHSSYDELERLMRFLQPSKIIPTVPVSQSGNIMPTIPKHWIRSAGPLAPKRMGLQTNITNFIRPAATTSSSMISKRCDKDDVIEISDDDEVVSLIDYMS